MLSTFCVQSIKKSTSKQRKTETKQARIRSHSHSHFHCYLDLTTDLGELTTCINTSIHTFLPSPLPAETLKSQWASFSIYQMLLAAIAIKMNGREGPVSLLPGPGEYDSCCLQGLLTHTLPPPAPQPPQEVELATSDKEEHVLCCRIFYTPLFSEGNGIWHLETGSLNLLVLAARGKRDRPNGIDRSTFLKQSSYRKYEKLLGV
ncbi:hypothetical protein J6590_020528 [Homalodisca vitripennis]|nr:hypothetical protein J6590_020528 [Homalodisca vitripennis]